MNPTSELFLSARMRRLSLQANYLRLSGGD